MRRKETKQDKQDMTDDLYISQCHDIIDYLETRLDNLIYEHHALMRFVNKKDFERYLQEIIIK